MVMANARGQAGLDSSSMNLTALAEPGPLLTCPRRSAYGGEWRVPQLFVSEMSHPPQRGLKS